MKQYPDGSARQNGLDDSEPRARAREVGMGSLGTPNSLNGVRGLPQEPECLSNRARPAQATTLAVSATSDGDERSRRHPTSTTVACGLTAGFSSTRAPRAGDTQAVGLRWR